jgi:acylphosphatase
MKHELVVFQGLVQGVFFRQAVLEIAKRHDVAGTVRNMADGSVEIDVEGEDGAVEAFLDDVIAHPPPAARVDRITREQQSPAGLRGFRPLHSERRSDVGQ